MDAGLPKDFSVPWFISHRTTLHRHKATLSCCWYWTYINKTSITLSCSKKVKVQMILYIVYVLQLWRNIVHTRQFRENCCRTKRNSDNKSNDIQSHHQNTSWIWFSIKSYHRVQNYESLRSFTSDFRLSHWVLAVPTDLLIFMWNVYSTIFVLENSYKNEPFLQLKWRKKHLFDKRTQPNCDIPINCDPKTKVIITFFVKINKPLS